MNSALSTKATGLEGLFFLKVRNLESIPQTHGFLSPKLCLLA